MLGSSETAWEVGMCVCMYVYGKQGDMYGFFIWAPVCVCMFVQCVYYVASNKRVGLRDVYCIDVYTVDWLAILRLTACMFDFYVLMTIRRFTAQLARSKYICL